MSQITRQISPLDRFLAELEHGLKTAFAADTNSTQTSPAEAIADSGLPETDRKLSEGLMRINHTGEIAAQALYRGQALVARNEQQRQALLQAADEEQDHLAWCQQRLNELGGNTSVLAPGWYLGSFLIGLTAGIAGDHWSLGFVEETENQVSAHLDDHMQRLAAADRRSHAILQQMREDEERHANAAKEAGAQELPGPIKSAMTQVANFMRFVSFRV